MASDGARSGSVEGEADLEVHPVADDAAVLDVVKAAYHLNLVVFALAPQAKVPECSRTFSTTAELQTHLSAVIMSPRERARALDELHRQRGPLSTPADYRRFFPSQ
ncbi:MAG TPA: hypothetical protein VHA80_07550 [Solirubrobacterales bacterium]|nr:hypothetical protein [Solirubrobacterales bacterium]